VLPVARHISHNRFTLTLTSITVVCKVILGKQCAGKRVLGTQFLNALAQSLWVAGALEGEQVGAEARDVRSRHGGSRDGICIRVAVLPG
jgi:hypothetical protein